MPKHPDRICGCVCVKELNTTPGDGVEFTPDGLDKKGKPMFSVSQPRVSLSSSTGASPSQPPLHFDDFGHPIGPSHRRPDGADFPVYTPGVGTALTGAIFALKQSRRNR